MLYIDTSSLLKLLWEEAESELEADVQLAGACLAGKYSRSKLAAYRRALNAFSLMDPFEHTHLPAQLFDVALRNKEV